MKKVTRIFGLVCLAGLLAFSTSCKKNQDTKEGSVVEISVPDGMMVDEGGERAYVVPNGTVYWLGDDQLVVYNLSDEFDESKRSVFHNVTGAGPRARFQGPTVGAKKTFGYRYFYPTQMVDLEYNEAQGDLANNNREHFIISPTQNYCRYTDGGHVSSIMDPDAMPMAVKPASLTSYAQLKHIFGVANVQLRAEDNEDVYVKQVELFDQGYNIWGTCSLCLHNVDITEGDHTGSLDQLWQLYKDGEEVQFAQMWLNYVMAAPAAGGLGWESDPQGNSIIMNCVHKDANGQNVYVKLENDPESNGTTQFMFLLRPLACSKGMVVKVTLVDDSEYLMTDYSYEVLTHPNVNINPLEYTLRPGYIKPFTFGTLHDGHVRPNVPQMEVKLTLD